jgi:DNA-binding NtrC family response regulator
MSQRNGEGSPPPTDLQQRDDRPVPERIRVIVLSGPERGTTVELGAGRHRVGKAPDCQLVLTDGLVSRHHLEIELNSEGVTVRDLGSKNGTLYQGARIVEMAVGPGAVLQLGATELKLSLVAASAPLLPSSADHFGALRGGSLAMRQIYAVLERVAASNVNVLIEGETGTGKELCAAAIHGESARAQAPFVICDLGGVTRSLMESELFGHIKGAFTGADRERKGAFVEAHQGSLFLDEVGELELDFQPRLLRAIESRKVKPVGGTGWREVDVRIIAASNRNLAEEVRAGRFRADLYHRLSVVRVVLPPLRERREDLPALCEQLLLGRGVELAPATAALLAEYDWPGNVRELRNVLERALSLLGGARIIQPWMLGLDGTAASEESSSNFKQAKERLILGWERNYLTRLLERTRGNITRAAREGGVDRAYLHRLLKKHGMSVPDDD